jgi:hypothetical protein
MKMLSQFLEDRRTPQAVYVEPQDTILWQTLQEGIEIVNLRVCPTFYTWRFKQGFASHDGHGGP